MITKKASGVLVAGGLVGGGWWVSGVCWWVGGVGGGFLGCGGVLVGVFLWVVSGGVLSS